MDSETFDHTYQPDILTSSSDYAKRFASAVGQYFLHHQEAIVADMLSGQERYSSMLDVGGGHGQLTDLLLRKAEHLYIHGSDASCGNRLLGVLSANIGVSSFVVSPLTVLPFPDRSIDVVVAFRLLAHTSNWRKFIKELCRVSKDCLIFDFETLCSFNLLTPVLFQIKKLIEGNTREYICYRHAEIAKELAKHGFVVSSMKKQFALPMGFHRALGQVGVSRRIENLFSTTGVTDVLGSPEIVLARRRQ